MLYEKNSIFNLAKIYEQIDFNEEAKYSALLTQGTFSWKNGIKDSKVQFTPNPNGRFKIISYIKKSIKRGKY